MRGSFELYLSSLVVAFLALAYIVYEMVSTPAGGHPFGHFLGILGASLMLMTEFLYSARKRWNLFKFGQVRQWLSFHIFTGIVGPALVLMHTGLEFRGLAGLTMFLTLVVVASGFLGRYIYTSVPRTMAGVEVDRRQLQMQAARQRKELAAWAAGKSGRIQAMVQQESARTLSGHDLSSMAILVRRIKEWQERRRLRTTIRKLEIEEQTKIAEIEQLLRRQQRLARQLRSLESVRKMMGRWHMFHVPLGLTLFSAMFIHIIAAVYYGGI